MVGADSGREDKLFNRWRGLRPPWIAINGCPRSVKSVRRTVYKIHTRTHTDLLEIITWKALETV